MSERARIVCFGELLVRNVQGDQGVGTMAAGVRLEQQTTDLRAATGLGHDGVADEVAFS